jgi:predicted enzyme related to lactoylglutathione lyase
MLNDGKLATLITVRNMSRAIRFYTKTLGGKVTMRAPGAMRNYWASLELGDAPVWLVAPDKVEKRKLAYSAFLVDDIRKEVAALQKKRVKFDRAQRSTPKTVVEGPIAWDPWGAAAFFKDTEGNLLMLWQDVTPE